MPPKGLKKVDDNTLINMEREGTWEQVEKGMTYYCLLCDPGKTTELKGIVKIKAHEKKTLHKVLKTLHEEERDVWKVADMDAESVKCKKCTNSPPFAKTGSQSLAEVVRKHRNSKTHKQAVQSGQTVASHAIEDVVRNLNVAIAGMAGLFVDDQQHWQVSDENQFRCTLCDVSFKNDFLGRKDAKKHNTESGIHHTRVLNGGFPISRAQVIEELNREHDGEPWAALGASSLLCRWCNHEVTNEGHGWRKKATEHVKGRNHMNYVTEPPAQSLDEVVAKLNKEDGAGETTWEEAEGLLHCHYCNWFIGDDEGDVPNEDLWVRDGRLHQASESHKLAVASQRTLTTACAKMNAGRPFPFLVVQGDEAICRCCSMSGVGATRAATVRFKTANEIAHHCKMPSHFNRLLRWHPLEEWPMRPAPNGVPFDPPVGNPSMIPQDARNAFLRTSPFFDVVRVRQTNATDLLAMPSEDDRDNMIKRFRERFFDPEKVHSCAACGHKQFEPLQEFQFDSPVVQKFKVSKEEDIQKYETDPEFYTSFLRRVKKNDDWYYLDSSTASVLDNKVQLCTNCTKDPKYPLNFKVGWDFGRVDHLPDHKKLPEPSPFELLCIQQVIHFQTLMKVRYCGKPVDQATKFSGHNISFEHNAVHKVTSLPDVSEAGIERIRQNLLLCFFGPKERKADAAAYFRRVVEVRQHVIIAWLKFLKEHNKYYEHITINEHVTQQELNAVADAIFSEENIIMDEDGKSRVRDVLAATGANQATAQYNEDEAQLPEQPVTTTLVTPPAVPNVDLEEVNTAQLRQFQEMLQGAAAEGVDEDDPMNDHLLFPEEQPAQPQEEQQPQQEPLPEAVKLHKVLVDNIPVNEFEQNEFLVVAGFPHLFPYFPEKNKFKVLTEKQLNYLARQQDGKYFEDSNFLFFHYNQKQRHSLTHRVAKRVKYYEGKKDQLTALLQIPDLSEKLDQAIANPTAPGNKLLLKRIENCLVTYTKHLSFSPAKRKACLGDIYAMHTFGGCPGVYYTFSYADNDNVATLLLSGMAREDIQLEIPMQTLGRRAQLVAKNPANAAIVWDEMLKCIFEVLFKCPEVSSFRATNAENTIDPGIWGNCKLHFTVIEEQGRGSLHAHGIAWGALHPDILQYVVDTKDPNPVQQALQEHINKCIEEMITTEITPLPEGMEKRKRPSLRRPATSGPEQQQLLHEIASGMQHHCKCTVGSCFSKSDKCRFAIDAPPVEKTGAYTIVDLEESAGTLLKHIKGLSQQQRDALDDAERDMLQWMEENLMPEPPETAANTLRLSKKIDPPPLAEETFGYERAPDNRATIYAGKKEYVNREVIGHNKTYSAAMRSNSAIFLLGSLAQAQAVLFYLIKYVTKDSLPLVQAAVFFRLARQLQETFASTAADAGSVSRNHKLFLHRFGNKMIGTTEISPQAAASVVLGHDSEYYSSKFAMCFIASAIKQYNELRGAPHIPDVFDETASDSEDDTEEDAVDLDDEEIGAAQEVVQELVGNHQGEATAGFQHQLMYAVRGDELEELCYYIYCAIISIEKKTPKMLEEEREQENRQAANNLENGNAQGQQDQQQQGNVRRPVNGVFQFAANHPLRKTHYQKLKSKYEIPKMLGRLPSRKSNPKLHALYMSVLFIPWSKKNLPLDFCDPARFKRRLFELKISVNFCDQTLAEIITSHALSINPPSHLKAANNQYRYRDAKHASKGDTAMQQLAQQAQATEDEAEAAREEALMLQQMTVESAKKLSLQQDVVAGLESVWDFDSVEAGPTPGADELKRQFLNDLSAENDRDRPKYFRQLQTLYYPKEPPVAQAVFNANQAQGQGAQSAFNQPGLLDHANPVNQFNALEVPELQDIHVVPNPDWGLNTGQVQAFGSVISGVFTQNKMMIHGGPGTGKSFLISKIQEKVEELFGPGTVAKFAPSCIAARNIKGHTSQSLQAAATKQTTGARNQIDSARNMGPVKLVIIDEVSMVGKAQLQKCDEALRAYGDPQQPFGGFAVLLVGDFYQLGPVRDIPIYRKTGKGLALLNFLFMQLTEQMRCRNANEMEEEVKRQNQQHIAMIDNLRSFDKTVVKNALEELLDNIQQKDASELDESIPIAVGSNLERQVLNKNRMRAAAKKRGLPLIAFKLHNDHVTQHHSCVVPWLYYCPGEPAVFTDNGCKAKGAINSARATFGAVTFDSKQKDEQFLQKIRQANPGDIIYMDAPKFVWVTIADTGSLYPCRMAAMGSGSDSSKPTDKKKQKGDKFIAVHDFSIVEKSYRPFIIEPAMAFTFHKVQGLTVDSLAIDLSKPSRGSGTNEISLESIYVAVTRVRRRNSLVLLKPREGTTALERKDFVLGKKPNEKLQRFMEKGLEDKDGHKYVRDYSAV